MKNNLILWLAALMVSAAFLTACNNNTTGKWKTTNDGLKYKFYEQNKEGNLPAEGDYVTVEMIYRTPDSTLFNSSKLPQPMELPMVKSVHQGDIYEGLYMMHVGDSATFECNADSVFQKLFRYRTVPKNLQGVKSIFFDVKLVKLTSKDEKLKEEQKAQQEHMEQMKKNKAEEAGKLKKYLADNNITVAPTADSLFIVITKKGSGPKPKVGDMVKVHYTGYLLDGTKFDSSVDRGKPFEFQLGKGRVIKGWDEGIAALNKGAKAKLIMPSKLAYGNRGAGGIIGPYSPLVFDVELIDFSTPTKK